MKVGDTYGSWVVIAPAERSARGKVQWLCRGARV